MITNNEQHVGRCLCVAVDAEGYGRSGDRQQFTAQKVLTEVLATAAEAAGLERDTWTRQPAGDGELALLSSNEPEPRVVDDLVREIDLALRRYNRNLVRDAQLRLRVAIHHGVRIWHPTALPVRPSLSSVDSCLAVRCGPRWPLQRMRIWL